MNNLINILLNGKKDIQFIPSAEDRAGAAKYAKSHGLRLADENYDMNNDGVKDNVLFNDGFPVMINNTFCINICSFSY